MIYFISIEAKKFGIPLNAIIAWMTNPEFRDYVYSINKEWAAKHKDFRMMALTKAFNARVEEAEENGYADFSRKDTLDIAEAIRKESGEERSVDNSYTNLLEKLVLNTTKQHTKLIVVEDASI